MRHIVSTPNAPAAIGPYSQANATDQLVFTSGQIPLTPAGTLVEGDVQVQTKQVLANLEAVLEAAGSSLEQVIKCTVFLADMADFKAMNEVYATAFPNDPPARSTFEVARLPMDAKVEIEAVALRSG